jgi:hypothetical protein
MNQELKDLFIKDLSARLPYGVKFECNKNVYTAKGLDLIVTDEGDWEYAVTAKGIAPIEIDFIKPYLFPLSSMTEEQRNEYHELLYNPKHGIDIDYFDWCHKNHLDCRGLIKKGLALNATGLNIYRLCLKKN